MIKKISYERRVYESEDDNNLSKAISQKNDEKNKSCNKGLKWIWKFLAMFLHLLNLPQFWDHELVDVQNVIVRVASCSQIDVHNINCECNCEGVTITAVVYCTRVNALTK